ncbi:MAG TPA: hypothetical protein VHF25_00430 [Nitriliruptorales bacterium]|nr:hypothetical protein [Nitriliruptorales bacterium]
MPPGGRVVLWALLAFGATVVAVVFDPKWVLAPLIGVAVYKVGTTMLRSMAADAHAAPGPPQPVLHRAERTLYWCEQCGAELLLVVRGATGAPRHCGERMHERVELLSDQ